MADPRPVPAAIRAADRLGLPVDVWHSEIEPDVASEVLARARFDRMTGFLAAAVLTAVGAALLLFRPVGFQNAGMAPDQRFQAAVSYSLRRPPRIGRRRILP